MTRDDFDPATGFTAPAEPGHPPVNYPAYGTQPGQQPGQHAGYDGRALGGYGVSGQPHSGPAPTPAGRKRRRWPVAVAVAGALIAGAAIGQSSQPAPKTVTVAGPERVVNHDVPGPTRTVAVTPESCGDALDLAEQMVTGPFASALQTASEVLTALSNGDVGGLSGQLAVLDRANRDLDRLVPRYKEAAAACRAGS